MTVKCEPITVGKTLNETQQAALIQAYENLAANGTSLTGLDLVNELYKQATGVENIFASTTHKTVTEGTDGCFVYYTKDTSSSSVYKLNPDGAYAKLLVPSLYGGYRLWASEFENDRTRLAKEQDLQIGDVLLGRVSSTASVTRPIYLYLGKEIGFINMSSLTADTVSVANRLERLLAYSYYYAIMRPMQALQ